MPKQLAITSFVLATLVSVLYGQGCTAPAPGTWAETENASAQNPRCAPPAGVSGSPQSIEDALALVNSLPKPVTVSCFVEALDRPLKVYATDGMFSAQPAAGARSPRFFIFNGPLIISVVPEGIGKDLVEFGVLVSDQMSLKAELEFPVLAELGPAAPYDRIKSPGGGTNCAGCHASETKSTAITFADAFVSRAIRPSPNRQVALDFMRQEAAACDARREPGRCAILNAIFGYGPVQDQSFPDNMPTF